MSSPLLVVTAPSGARSRILLERPPFSIGRLGDNDLVLRDGRASRHHARIVEQGGRYFVEDLKSRYGVYVNGTRVDRAPLADGDRIEFGAADSYRITFHMELPAAAPTAEHTPLGGTNLAKLRATLEVARALQTSLSTEQVLIAVVEAALTVTGLERGFLLIRSGEDLDIQVARSRHGLLAPDDLRVPTRLLLRALDQRREFLSMNFDPNRAGQDAAGRTVADLELRSVVCVPLVRIRAGSVSETTAITAGEDSIGVLYMDSRAGAADLSAGGRELLTTLALEASTVLENARLLEEVWSRQRIAQELKIAREIQASLLPPSLPSEGWFRAAGSTVPSTEVGGDYFDVRSCGDAAWACVVVDVSGKGVGAALLAALLEGMFLAAPYTNLPLGEIMLRTNRFLNERTGGEQYATAFYSIVERNGVAHWINAGHPPPVVVRGGGRLAGLAASGLPLGLLEDAEFAARQLRLEPRDKIVIFSDGLTEARNPANEFFGLKRVREAVRAAACGSCREIHDAVLAAVESFTSGAEQRDDITLAVIEYAGE